MASVITIAGEQLFAAKAQANEQLDIDTFIFANVPGQDPNAPINRSEGIPTAHIVHQQIVQQVGRINENVVVYSTVLDSVTGPFEFNWVGLYSSVNDKLVAINHVPTVTKTVTEPGAAGNTLNRNFGIEYSGIAELAGITVAPETWQLDFTARLTGMDELTRQLAADMNGKDWFIGDGFKVEPRATVNTFKVTAGAGYVSGLRVELTADHILTLSSYPQFVYVDAWFDGTSGSQWKGQTAFTVTNTEMDDYVDVTGKQHYVFKLATITAADEVTDHRSNSAIKKTEKRSSKTVLMSEFATPGLSDVDQRLLMQEAVNYAAENGAQLVVDGGYYLSTDVYDHADGYSKRIGLYIQPKSRILFSPGAFIKKLYEPSAPGVVMDFYLSYDFEVHNPDVRGDYEERSESDPYTEWSHAFDVTSCENGYLFRPKAYGFAGDGIYIGPQFFGVNRNVPKDITIFEPKTDLTQRNGISLCGGDNVNIIRPNCTRNISGPACIDVEPEIGGESVTKLVNCVIDTPTTGQGSCGLLLFLNKGEIDLNIIGVHRDKGSLTGFKLVTILPDSTLKGSVHIERIESKEAGNYGVDIENIDEFINFSAGSIKIVDPNQLNNADQDAMRIRNQLSNNRAIANINIGTVEVIVNDGAPQVRSPITITRESSVVTLAKELRINQVKSKGTLTKKIIGGVGFENNCYIGINHKNVIQPDGDFQLAESIEVSSDGNETFFYSYSRLLEKGITITKTKSGGSLTVQRPGDGSQLIFNGNNVASISTSSVGGKMQIVSGGDFIAVAIPLSGVWV